MDSGKVQELSTKARERADRGAGGIEGGRIKPRRNAHRESMKTSRDYW